MISTFAWFQVQASAATIKTVGGNNSVSINKDSTVSATMNAKIHLVLTEATNSESIPLTTWVDEDQNANDDVHSWSLYTGGYLQGDIYTNARLSELGTQTTGYITYKVSAWLEDTSSSGEKQTAGHAAAWKQSVTAITTAADHQKVFTFSYDDETAVTPNTRLLEADTKYYYKANNSTVEAIDHDLEVAALKTLTVDAKDLLTSYTEYEYASSTQPMKQYGFLYVRAEGSLRDHSTTDYTLTLKVAGNADEQA